MQVLELGSLVTHEVVRNGLQRRRTFAVIGNPQIEVATTPLFPEPHVRVITGRREYQILRAGRGVGAYQLHCLDAGNIFPSSNTLGSLPTCETIVPHPTAAFDLIFSVVLPSGDHMKTPDLDAVEKVHVNPFLDSCLSRNEAPSTENARLAAVGCTATLHN